jgi:exosortase
MNAAVDSPSVPRRTTERTIAERARELGPSVWVAAAALALLIVAIYFDALKHLVMRWSRESDYSHGFLVPVFSAWLLWQRRSLLKSVGENVRGRWLGLVLLAASAGIRAWNIYFNFPLVEPVALVVCLAGVAGLIGGYPVLLWSWPSILFLFFMIPLPGAVAGQLSGPLQHLATVCSTFVLQTLGIPAIATGNVIWLSQGKIGVVEACSGLRMLVMFGAITVAAAFLLNVSSWEKVCLLASAVPIALASNIFRITVTGMAQEFVGAELAHRIFHDLAGWIMMPLAIVLLMTEVFLLARLFPQIAVDSVMVVRAARGPVTRKR